VEEEDLIMAIVEEVGWHLIDYVEAEFLECFGETRIVKINKYSPKIIYFLLFFVLRCFHDCIYCFLLRC
jgi:hypothetical protein